MLHKKTTVKLLFAHYTKREKHKVKGVYLVYTCVISTLRMFKSMEIDTKALYL